LSEPLSREDETLLRLLKTPPKPFTPKAKKNPSPAKDKGKKARWMRTRPYWFLLGLFVIVVTIFTYYLFMG
jgi:hypothetical protein